MEGEDTSDVYAKLSSSPGASGSQTVLLKIPPLSGRPSLSRGLSAVTESSLLTSLPNNVDNDEQPFYVDVRRLSQDEKRRYVTDWSERPVTDEEAFPADMLEAVVGESTEDGVDYYYVRLEGGMVFRVCGFSCGYVSLGLIIIGVVSSG